jgi:hypothetical protein
MRPPREKPPIDAAPRIVPESAIPLFMRTPEGRREFRYRTDDSLVCLTLNQLLDDRPQLLDEAARNDIKRDLTERLGPPRADEYPPAILPALADVFASRNVNPFAGLRLSIVGAGDLFPDGILGPRSASLRDMFGEIVDFHPQRTEKLTQKSAARFAEDEKFDAILTCNALNDPRYPKVRETMAAVAQIAKPGASIVHGIGYSDDHYGVILDRDFHAACGQETVGVVNPARSLIGGAKLIDALVLRQARGPSGPAAKILN